MEHTSLTQARFMTKTMPRVIAHKILHLDDPCYETFMLMHFKPFNLDRLLLTSLISVHDKFITYDFSPCARTCMSNWEALHECEDKRDTERMKKTLFPDEKFTTIDPYTF